MDNKKIFKIVAVILLGMFSFLVGYNIGKRTVEYNNVPQDMISYIDSEQVSQAINEMPPGTTIEITVDEGTTPMYEYSEGETVGIGSDKWFNRTLSFFGLGAVEGSVQDKGLLINDSGSSGVMGRSEGFGILEKFWQWLKSIFWTLSFIGLGLVILLFIPATSSIASMILRFIGSAIPFFGSLIERIFSGLKLGRPLKQIISGGQKFKTAIDNNPRFTAEQKLEIKEMFNTVMMGEQDKSSQQTVKSIKSNGNM